MAFSTSTNVIGSLMSVHARDKIYVITNYFVTLICYKGLPHANAFPTACVTFPGRN